MDLFEIVKDSYKSLLSDKAESDGGKFGPMTRKYVHGIEAVLEPGSESLRALKLAVKEMFGEVYEFEK